MHIPRSIDLPEAGETSFFLWGPRQTGKSTLLKARYPQPDNRWFDLLDRQTHRNFKQNPENLRLELERHPPAQPCQIVIDEVQEIPDLLAEVHLMIENLGYSFALCGSSSRKLVRGNHHLLGGRAVRFNLRGLTAHELGSEFNLERMLNHGYFPTSYFARHPQGFFDGYIHDYLLNEIIKEAAVRKLDRFEGFLEAAALRDGSLVNYSSIARESGVSYKTVQSYYGILTDTYLGYWLPAFSKSPKGSRPRAAKFYFCDVGLVNFLARRAQLIESQSADFGKAFENWVFHELSAYLDCQHRFDRQRRLSYWRQGKSEVDFLIGDRVAIEVKSSQNITGHSTRGLRSLARQHPSFETLLVVCREEFSRQTTDGVQILNYRDFVTRLWAGEYTGG